MHDGANSSSEEYRKAEKERIDAETAKLLAEGQAIARPFFRQPTFYYTLVVSLTALFGSFGQCMREKQRADLEKQRASSAQELADVSHKLAEARKAQLQGLEQEKKSVEEEIKGLRGEKETLEQQTTALKKEERDLEQQVTRLKEDKRNLKEEKNKVDEVAGSQEDKLAGTRKKLEKLKGELASVEPDNYANMIKKAIRIINEALGRRVGRVVFESGDKKQWGYICCRIKKRGSEQQYLLTADFFLGPGAGKVYFEGVELGSWDAGNAFRPVSPPPYIEGTGLLRVSDKLATSGLEFPEYHEFTDSFGSFEKIARRRMFISTGTDKIEARFATIHTGFQVHSPEGPVLLRVAIELQLHGRIGICGGAPVATEDGILIGMVYAASSDGRVIIVPAWEILRDLRLMTESGEVRHGVRANVNPHTKTACRQSFSRRSVGVDQPLSGLTNTSPAAATPVRSCVSPLLRIYPPASLGTGRASAHYFARFGTLAPQEAAVQVHSDRKHQRTRFRPPSFIHPTVRQIGFHRILRPPAAIYHAAAHFAKLPAVTESELGRCPAAPGWGSPPVNLLPTRWPGSSDPARGSGLAALARGGSWRGTLSRDRALVC